MGTRSKWQFRTLPFGIDIMISLCELLKTAYHFNFRSNVLTMVVRQMNNRQSEKIGDSCCQAVEHVFQKDAQGEVSMEAARLVAKLIKEYKAHKEGELPQKSLFDKDLTQDNCKLASPEKT